jgi:hypothetical protein
MGKNVVAKSGEICSESGIWVSIDPEKKRIELSKGEEIPFVGKKSKRWRLLLLL